MSIYCVSTWLVLLAASAVCAHAAEIFERDIPVEFDAIVPPGAQLEKLAGGLKFTEGPAWFDDAQGGFLVFSDIPGDTLWKWTAASGLQPFRQPSHNANGNFAASDGRLLTCEHGSRSVTITEKNGTITTVADKYQGKRLNSPNDIVMKSDGTIWFSDPPYGIKRSDQEQAGQYVFRLDLKTKELRIAAGDFDMPNGLCFSPDEKLLYIDDSGAPHHVRVFDVRPDGTLANSRVFCVIDKGVPDGIRCDSSGRLFSSAQDGVHIYRPDGTLIGRILVPETVANLCFGGAERKTLFMTARTTLYAIKLNVAGVR